MTAVAAHKFTDSVECRLVADAVWALFRDGLLPMDPATVRRAARAAGLVVDDLRLAAVRAERGNARKPSREATMSLDEPPNRHAHTGAATRERMARKNPTPTTRRCSRCSEVLPLAQFPIKNRATGTRKSACHDCCREYQRDRYLTVEKAKAVNTAVLIFEAHAEDGCIGQLCTVCRVPFRIGDLIEGFATLAHAECAAKQ